MRIELNYIVVRVTDKGPQFLAALSDKGHAMSVRAAFGAVYEDSVEVHKYSDLVKA